MSNRFRDMENLPAGVESGRECGMKENGKAGEEVGEEQDMTVRVDRIKRVSFGMFLGWVAGFFVMLVVYKLVSLEGGDSWRRVAAGFAQGGAILFGLAAFGHGLKLVYRGLQVVRHVPGAQFPPGITVALLCLPVLNFLIGLFVMTGFARKWEELRVAAASGRIEADGERKELELPKVEPGIFAATMLILLVVPFSPEVVLLGFPVMLVISMRQLTRAVNSVAV